MLAKEAKKIIEDHLRGKETLASRSILSKIYLFAKKANYKPPFKISMKKKAAWEISMSQEGWSNVYENLKNMPSEKLVEALADDDYEAQKFDIPAIYPRDLGVDFHKFHRSQQDPIYEVGSLIYAGKPVEQDHFDAAVERLKGLVGRLINDEAEEELGDLLWELDTLEPNYIETPDVNKLKEKYKHLPQDILADEALKRIEENNTADTGGHAVWIDQEGYHTVPVDLMIS